jgi:hypothetical protein
VHTHTGRVLALGPPARTKAGAEVAHGFTVGDLVQYHFVHNQAAATMPWVDGEPATWVPQECVDGVWEDPALLALATKRAHQLATEYLGVEPLQARALPDGSIEVTPKGYTSHVTGTIQLGPYPVPLDPQPPAWPVEMSEPRPFGSIPEAYDYTCHDCGGSGRDFSGTDENGICPRCSGYGEV